MAKLEPNEYGNYPCPHCEFILTPILREWMKPPRITDYICHRCKIGFEVKSKINGYQGDITTLLSS